MAENVRKIAKRAQVSTATVSRVIHQSDKVKPSTRERVEAAMQEMGLNPEELIRSAKTDTRIIGVLVPDLTNMFFVEMIQGIEDVAKDCGISLFICHTKESDQNEIHYLRLLKEARVCGIIITPTSDDDDSVNNEYLNLLSSMNIPIVLVDRDVKYSRYDGVFIDNERGAFEATNLLLENGHTRIALISGPLNTTPGRDRMQGYRSAFARMQRPVDEELIFYGDFSIASGETLTREILQRHPDVTAIFPVNNMMTLGCLAALRKAGYSVPEDMAVVGFDRVDTLDMLGIPLSVVGRPTREMGQQAMKLLSKQLAGRRSTVARRITLMPELCVNGSEKYFCSEQASKDGKGASKE